MDAAGFAIAIVALLLGGIIGWLWASREGAGARQTVATLRLQLDEVVKERDVNRDAATKLAALEAAQAERDLAHQRQLEALETRFAEVSNKLLVEARELIVAQGLAAGDPPQELTGPAEQVPLHATRS